MKRVIFLLLAGLLLVVPQVLAQNSAVFWSAPVLMGDGWWQSLTVDRQGTVYVGWYGARIEETSDGGTRASDLLLLRSRPLSGEWSPLQDVIYTVDGGYTVRNSVNAAPNGVLYTAYRNGVAHRVSSVYTSTSLDARAWVNPVEVNTSGYYLDMLVDQDNVLHLVTSEQGANLASNPNLSISNQEQYDCLICSDTIYRRSTDGGETWTTAVNLSQTFDGGSDRVEIVQGPSGRIYVNWDEGGDWYIGRGTPQDVRFVYSEDGGETWSDPVILDGGALLNRRPIQLTLTEIADERLIAVWRYSMDDDPVIYFQISEDLGQTWTDPEPIPDLIGRLMSQTPLDNYELITDTLGIGHLFVVARPETNPTGNASLYHVEYRQGRWRTPQLVFQGETNVWPEWPQAAVGPKNDLHLTWFVRRVRRTASGYDPTAGLQVYYAYRDGTVPTAPTQAFVPTPLPAPTEARVRVFDATPTPFPTVEPIQSVIVRANSDIYATRILVGGIFVSLVFCGVVLVLAGFRPRR